MMLNEATPSMIHEASETLLELLRDRLLRNAGYVLGSTILNAGAGFLFWALAARLYTSEEVGFASAVISIVTLLAGIANLGLGIGIVRYLPGHEQPRRTLNATFTLASLTSVLIGIAYLLGIRTWSPSLSVLAERPFYALGLLFFILVCGLNTMLQMAYLACMETSQSLWQVAVMNALRLALVAALAFAGAPGVVAAVALAMGLADLIGIFVLLPRVMYGFRPRPVLAFNAWRQMVPYSLGNYLSGLLYSAPMMLAPPLALERLGAATSAHVYMAWMIGSILACPGLALSQSSFAEGSNAPTELRRLLLRSSRIAAAVTIPLAVIVVLGARWVLLLFGASYVAEGVRLLRWLAAAAPLVAFTNLYFSGLRVQDRVGKLMLLSALVAVVSLAAPYMLLERWGVESMGIGWLAAQSIVLFVAAWRLWKERNAMKSSEEKPANTSTRAPMNEGSGPIVVAIPCYNEERFIGEVVHRARAHADHIVVVDDGSTDNTAGVARGAGAQVVRHEVNMGPGAAARDCLKAGRRLNARVLVTLDGDGQHEPDEIPEVAALVLEGEADLVIGSRFLGKPNNVARYRKFGIDVITFLYNFGARKKISDAQSCFRAYSRRALEALCITEDGFGFSVETLVQGRHAGLHIREASILCVYHEESHSANPVLHGLGVALMVLKHRALAGLNAYR